MHGNILSNHVAGRALFRTWLAQTCITLPFCSRGGPHKKAELSYIGLIVRKDELFRQSDWTKNFRDFRNSKPYFLGNIGVSQRENTFNPSNVLSNSDEGILCVWGMRGSYSTVNRRSLGIRRSRNRVPKLREALRKADFIYGLQMYPGNP